MRIIVIGSGFGGLAAAIRLQAQGHEVTVVEQRDQAGGRAYVYRQDGFTFDGGPTIITAPWLIEKTVCTAYRGLVPMSPKTTPSASSVRAALEDCDAGAPLLAMWEGVPKESGGERYSCSEQIATLRRG